MALWMAVNCCVPVSAAEPAVTTASQPGQSEMIVNALPPEPDHPNDSAAVVPDSWDWYTDDESVSNLSFTLTGSLPNSYYISFYMEDASIAAVEWGGWSGNRAFWLTVRTTKAGETNLVAMLMDSSTGREVARGSVMMVVSPAAQYFGSVIYAYLRHADSGRNLEWQNGRLVVSEENSYSARQIWCFEWSDDYDCYRLINEFDGQSELYSPPTMESGTELYVDRYWEDDLYNKWNFYKSPNGSGRYIIRNVRNPYCALDLPWNDATPGNALQLWENNFGGAQDFQVIFAVNDEGYSYVPPVQTQNPFLRGHIIEGGDVDVRWAPAFPRSLPGGDVWDTRGYGLYINRGGTVYETCGIIYGPPYCTQLPNGVYEVELYSLNLNYDFITRGLMGYDSDTIVVDSSTIPCPGDRGCPGGQFKDMPKASNWAHNPIDWAIVKGITGGTDATHFSPNATCTREQVMTFLWTAYGKPQPSSTKNPFKDVKAGKYYVKPILWAVEKGITGGVEKDRFGVGESCTRAQVMTFLWVAAGRPQPKTSKNPFTDVKSTDYFYKPVLWAVEKGITGGTSKTTFGPKNTCTRAQVLAFLFAALVKNK